MPLFFRRPKSRWSDWGAASISVHLHGPRSHRHEPNHRLACQGGEDRAQTQHHPLQWRGDDHRHHHRLGHFRHSNGRGQRDGFGRALAHRLVRLWSDLHHGRPVLRWAWHHHHQVGGRLHLHPGGVRRAGSFSKAVGGDAHHPAVLAVRGVAGVCHLPSETAVPKLPRARQRSQAHRLPVS